MRVLGACTFVRRGDVVVDATESHLVERFERNIDQYKSPGYNETQLRREFLDPSFEALGWDVNNRAGYAERRR